MPFGFVKKLFGGKKPKSVYRPPPSEARVKPIGQYDGQVNVFERFRPSEEGRGLADLRPAYGGRIRGELSRPEYDTSGRRDARALEAATEAGRQHDLASDMRERDLLAAGVRPDSGAFGANARQASIDRALGVTGAANQARMDVRREGLEDRNRRLDIARAGAQLATTERAQDIDLWRQETGFRGADANRSLGLWQAREGLKQGNVRLAQNLYGMESGIRAGDVQRRQRWEQNAMSSIGSLLGGVAGSVVGGPIGGSIGSSFGSSLFGGGASAGGGPMNIVPGGFGSPSIGP